LAEVCNAQDDNCDGVIDETGCPCPVRHRGGHAYLFCNDARGWSSARAACMAAGYDLVVLNDGPENDWVWTQASGVSVIDWWIGIRDWRSDFNYGWVDGSFAWVAGSGSSGYTNFRGSGAPDGSGDCVELGGDGWNDVSCDQATGYVCESP
jgi:hypothetical protein